MSTTDSGSTAKQKTDEQGPILIASDHAGFELKELLKRELPHLPWKDLGPASAERVDYPDFADQLASRIAQGEATRGLLVCGSGQGMAIRANRYRHIRAALAWNEESARLSREHNDANVLCLGSRMISSELAKRLVEIFLSTSFEGGRHQGRIDKLGRPSLC